MSNRLLNLAKRVNTVAGRKIHPSEKGVLMALADDAREHLGGRSRLTAKQLADITGFSRRAVGMAIAVLADEGHISREPGEPGAPITTLVHPSQSTARVEPIATGHEPIAKVGRSHCQGSIIEGNNNQYSRPEHHATGGRAREPAAAVDQEAADPVEQVFAAWDAFHQRAGLQYPVARGMNRRAAVAARIADHGLGNALMIVDRTERAVKERRQPKGQGDMFFSFDMVFGVGKAANIGIFERMLDGEFTPPEPTPAPPSGQAALDDCHPGEGPAEAAIRTAARAALGESTYRAWLEPAGLRLDGDELVITTTSRFAADHITNQIAPRLRRPGLAIRVEVERITA